MTTQIPTNPEEARKLQERIQTTYRALTRARLQGRSFEVRTRIADMYIRQLDRMLQYKRQRGTEGMKLQTLGEALEELKACKAKLNDQKVQIEQLKAAVTLWRQEAAPKPLAVYNRSWRVPISPDISRTAQERVGVIRLLAQWGEDIDVPGTYTIRLLESSIPANLTDTPWDTYQVTLHVWEKPNHGSTNHNKGE